MNTKGERVSKHTRRESQLTYKVRGLVNTKGEGGGGQLIHIERGSQLTHSERGGEDNQQVEGMVYMLWGKSTYTGKWKEGGRLHCNPLEEGRGSLFFGGKDFMKTIFLKCI